MAKTYANQDPISALRNHCEAISLPQQLKLSVINDIQKWYQNNGPAYVVDRLKFVKQCAVKYLTSGELPPKDSSIWFRRNKDGLLYGHWATLMKLMLHQEQEVMKLLMAYTVFATDSKPTNKQIEKFQKAIEEPFTGDSQVLTEISFYLYRDSRTILEKYLPGSKKHLVQRDVALPKPYVLNGRFNNDSHKTNIHKDALDALYQPAMLNHALRMPWIKDVFSHDVREHMGLDLDNEDAGVITYRPTIMGNVNWINEPGLKERIVTDFNKAYEHLTFPLGKRLYSIVKHLPWDSTFKESYGYELIQEALKQGQTCYCYDMSKATDRFPVVWQEWVLKSLNLGKNYADQLEILKTLIHESVKLPNGNLTKWAVGQPMGAFPSFAMFTLTHGLLLMQYLYSRGIEYSGQFVVHGDDIVIMDDELADYYKVVIDYSGNELNDFKTIISKYYAEFNSRLITKDGFILMRKYRPVSVDNLMDQVTFWGPKCINWLPVSRGKKEQIIKILSVPNVLPNGNSINPNGLKAEERVKQVPEEVLNALLTTDSKAMNYESHRAIVVQHLRNNTSFNDLNFDGREVYCDAILQMHLASLQLSDTLDREILEDSSDFIEFFDMDKKGVYSLRYPDKLNLGPDAPDTNKLLVAQSMFGVLGHMKKAFDDVIFAGSDISVSISDIRSYNQRKSLMQHKSSSKLNKALRLFARTNSQSQEPKLKQA